MRVQLWFAPILGVCLLMASGMNVAAQFPGQNPGIANGPAPTMAYDAAVPGGVWAPQGYEDVGMPGSFGPYGMVDGGHVVPYNSAIATQPPGPPGANPWPHISPFENRFDQTYNQDGLWFNEVDNSPRRYFFNINYMRPHLPQPGNRKVGDKMLTKVDISNQQGPGGGGGGGMPTGPMFGTFTTNRGMNGGNDGESVFKHDFKTNGIRGQWGFTETDESGFQMDAWWATDVNYAFDTTLIRRPTTMSNGRGGPRIFQPDPFYAPVPPAIVVREPNGSLTTLPFDDQFRLIYQSEAFGTGAQWLFSPIRDRGYYQIQPLAGLRYFNIQEGFGFVGRDSNLFPNRDYFSFFNSFVNTHLVGPEVGLKYQLGGEKFFTFKGETKAGLMYNFTDANLEGEGFGLAANLTTSSFPFDFKERNSHASPMFEQNVTMEFRIFSIIPVLKRMAIMDDAVFRVAYTYVSVGEVERPADIIEYQSAPFTPLIQHNRSKWDMGAWQLGIDWKF